MTHSTCLTHPMSKQNPAELFLSFLLIETISPITILKNFVDNNEIIKVQGGHNSTDGTQSVL